ncbi:Crp/Fnr family transcriptional regulator [Niabella beijingensis]|uniref:Crp/Fnr family transcriptional regulator n=1 Tax=Niabella beijingensis TaxID=2872700 RepID=UPI001CBF62CC|nr:Crp/Fnr family transcriptional regulator [Niabella beijingensis]MBZ4190209.1 Crp/Fnr family transcriptional regulator [Niabella beijingensis]
MKKAKEGTAVTDSFLYRMCMPEWWPALDVHCRIWKFKKGAVLFSAGEEVKGIYFVIDGVVKVHKRWEQEKDLIIRFAGPDDILGHRGLSTHSAVYPVGATAIASGTLCFLELAFFHKTLAVNQRLLYAFMLFFADELQLSEQRMQELAHVPVKKRVARAILEIHKKIGTVTDAGPAINISRQDLAAYTGATYETVYRFLLEFSEQGWIAATGRQLLLCNVPALQQLAT